MKQVSCPTCGALSPWSTENAFRPFCSERCKLIDLGAWASDRYAISGKPTDEGDVPAAEEGERD
ncbi:MAG TPA: DNA gyrase inhibitor YacG [Burkholderiaceae bacterium]|nr:DNA gyrase inhibitor YacG [Burkholderiaceae bacterium]HQR72558.1 DNA gyrase inhibitor YacG [Burkholderiaceae bacterium]